MSVCAGQSVVGDTDHKPVLQLTGLVAGHYVFVLEVTDEAGQKSSSTASVLVKPGQLTFCHSFYPHNAILSRVLAVALFVSVTRRFSVETAEQIELVLA